jgi:hypothetical protein
MAEIINFFFDLQTNIKLYHWMTTSYPRHKASDDLSEKILDTSDRFMEVYIGKYGRPTMNKKHSNIYLQKLDDKNVVKYLDYAINFLLNDLMLCINKSDVDLLNIRDEMVGTLNQTKYLFTLS